MPKLKIYSDDKVESLVDFTDIKTALAAINIDIQQWNCKHATLAKASQEDILEAYQVEVKQIMDQYRFKGVDVINMNAANHNPEKISEMRNKFLDEHIHTDDEVRYFVDGEGLFCVHADSKVYAILCSKGDFISVPANTKHWFDMGSAPNFKCIRFFGEATGWIADYTGDSIAKQYPTIEEFVC